MPQWIMGWGGKGKSIVCVERGLLENLFCKGNEVVNIHNHFSDFLTNFTPWATCRSHLAFNIYIYIYIYMLKHLIEGLSAMLKLVDQISDAVRMHLLEEFNCDQEGCNFSVKTFAIYRPWECVVSSTEVHTGALCNFIHIFDKIFIAVSLWIF